MLVFYVNSVTHTYTHPSRCDTQESSPLLETQPGKLAPYLLINLTQNRDIAISQQFSLPIWFCSPNMTEHLCSVHH